MDLQSRVLRTTPQIPNPPLEYPHLEDIGQVENNCRFHSFECDSFSTSTRNREISSVDKNNGTPEIISYATLLHPPSTRSNFSKSFQFLLHIQPGIYIFLIFRHNRTVRRTDYRKNLPGKVTLPRRTRSSKEKDNTPLQPWRWDSASSLAA